MYPMSQDYAKAQSEYRREELARSWARSRRSTARLPHLRLRRAHRAA